MATRPNLSLERSDLLIDLKAIELETDAGKDYNY